MTSGQERAPVAHPRRVRSFVRREGRLTTGQAQALSSLWPVYGFTTADAGDADRVFGRSAPLVLEIGLGNGDATLWRAERDPERNYLGVEVHRPGVGGLLHRAHQAGVANLRVACVDAVELVEALPRERLAACIIEFPDPWPKRRHHKRRLIQPDFVAVLAERLAYDGRLLLATDWAEYAEHMVAVCNAEPRLRNVADDGGFVPRPDSRPPTRFEQRGVRRGHAVHDLEYRRV